MNADWLAPPPDIPPGPPAAPAESAFDLLLWLQREDPRQRRAAGAALPAAYGDAFHAWGVSCYEAGHYRAAATIFGHLCRVQPDEARHHKAAAASHLAAGEPVASAAAYQRAHALARSDAETLYFWGQAALLAGDAASGAERLRLAQTLARSQPHKWPELAAWCTELLERIAAGPPASGWAQHRP